MSDNQARDAELVAENRMLRGLIKVLCSDPSPFGSEAFQRTRDSVNPEHRALLLAVLNDGPKRPPELSPEERAKRADQRDRGLLNDGVDHGEG